jgi:hypothetical protein
MLGLSPQKIIVYHHHQIDCAAESLLGLALSDGGRSRRGVDTYKEAQGYVILESPPEQSVQIRPSEFNEQCLSIWVSVRNPIR